MSHGGSWPQETPYGSGGHISAGAPLPQTSSSSPDLINNGGCAPSFDPHLLTEQYRSKARLLVVVFWGLVKELVVVEKGG